MNKTDFEALIAGHPLEIKAKGIALFNGVMAGIATYNQEKTSAALKNWQASEAAFKKFVDSITSTPTNEKTFNGIPTVVEYLRGQGWKMSLRTGYNHRDKKLLLPRKDGKYYQSDVDRYASGGSLQRLDGIRPEPSDADSDRKRKAEADSAEYDARIKRIRAEEIEGRYVAREIFQDELAAQALAFRNAIQTYIHAQAEEIVNFVGGDVSRIPDLIEFMLTRADEHFLRFAEQLERTGRPEDIEKVADDDESDNEDGRDDDEDGLALWQAI